MHKASLAHEIDMLRSLAVSLVGRDKEGVYRPEFVQKTLRALQQKPTKRFVDERSFLAQLSKHD